MKQIVIDEIVQVARRLCVEGVAGWDGYIVNPMAVYNDMRARGSMGYRHIVRYCRGSDPYQIIKYYVPRDPLR